MHEWPDGVCERIARAPIARRQPMQVIDWASAGPHFKDETKHTPYRLLPRLGNPPETTPLNFVPDLLAFSICVIPWGLRDEATLLIFIT
jgi:hypothetical protein